MMTDAMWLLMVAVLACAGLHFSPEHSVRELVFGAITIAAVFAIPLTALCN